MRHALWVTCGDSQHTLWVPKGLAEIVLPPNCVARSGDRTFYHLSVPTLQGATAVFHQADEIQRLVGLQQPLSFGPLQAIMGTNLEQLKRAETNLADVKELLDNPITNAIDSATPWMSAAIGISILLVIIVVGITCCGRKYLARKRRREEQRQYVVDGNAQLARILSK